MENKFFQFVETYWDDIAAFFEALRAWVEAIVGKLGTSDEETTAEA